MFARRMTAIFSTIAVLASSVLVLGVASSASAATEPFDPGHLLTDSLMYDGDSMSIAQIQSFLDKKGASCVAESVPCLKDYKAIIHSKPLDPTKPDRCIRDIKGSSTQRSAATIIFVVARDCGVSAKVLLVTLQKEQGLVASDAPSKRNYQAATGYDCPDNGTCNPEVAGFFNQVYWAARAYRAYRIASAYPTYQPGLRNILYHPDPSDCGRKAVNVQNLATTALYTYTPYTPNRAALANPYKTGDSCSSYGNRNFWLYYNAWFGNSGAGDFLLINGATRVLAFDGMRWNIPSTASRLRSLLSTTDASAKVSSAYLESLTDRGRLGLVVTSDTGSVYFLAGSSKYRLASCSVADAAGFPCATAPDAPSALLAKVPTSTSVSTLSRLRVHTSAGEHFVLENGERREFVSSASVGGAALGTALEIDSVSVAPVPVGVPYLPGNDLVGIRGTSDYVARHDGVVYRFTGQEFAQARFSTWFGNAEASLNASSVNALGGTASFPHIFSDGTTTFALSSNGKIALDQPSEWVNGAPTVSEASAAAIPNAGTIAGSAFVRSATSTAVYLVHDGERRRVASTTDREVLARALSISATVRTLPNATVAAITPGPAVVAPGAVVRSSSTGAYFVIDGTNARVRIATGAAAEFLGASSARTLSDSTLSGYAISAGTLLPGINCGSTKYLSVSGVRRAISNEDAAEYGSAYGFTSLSPETCSAFSSAFQIGTFLKYSGRYYVVSDGSRRLISASEYSTLSAGKVPAKEVSRYFLQLLPSV